jgi:tRNA threonylcarbamoyladenosine dehydratase
MFDRIEKLIGKENIKKIISKKILLVGVGGVGGTTLETLVRSGIENITIIDNDTFEESNLNRQILANVNVLNNKKVKVGASRSLLINPDIKIIAKDIFLNKDNINKIGKFDYIIDACDTTETKVELIKYALSNNIKIISSMGMGNRLDPTKVIITTLSKTSNDPLAKKVKEELKKAQINNEINVVSSTETPIKSKNIITSMMPVPSVAGIYLAYYVINDIIKSN